MNHSSLTLGHVNQASCEQSNTVGGLVVVQVLEPPASDVGLLVHETRGVADHLEETLLLALVQVFVQEVVSGGKPDQRVRQRNFIPGGIFHQPATQTITQSWHVWKTCNGKQVWNVHSLNEILANGSSWLRRLLISTAVKHGFTLKTEIKMLSSILNHNYSCITALQ